MLTSKPLVSATLLALAALNGQSVQAHRWFNWQVDISCDATGFFVPTNESQLVDFVKEQYPRKTHLRPVGNGHGFGNLTTCVNDADTDRDSYILSLTNLKELQIYKENNTVTFGGGWDLVDLIPVLHDSGIQVHNLGSEKVQNYIGAATTGTHGTGKENQNLATQILSMRVLDAKGDIHVIDKDHDLEAYRVAIGALGIIVEVTVQGEPVTMLKRTTELWQGPSNITEFYHELAKYADKHEQVNVNGPNFVWDEEQKTLIPNTNVTFVYWEETDYTGPANCSNYCSNDCGICNMEYTCYDYKMNSIATTPPGICYRGFMGQFEHFFPIEHLAEIGPAYFNHAHGQSDRLVGYQGVNDIAERQGVAYYQSDDVTVITRFVKGDDTWLSPVNTYNLPEGSSGIFATLEYSWIPSYNNFTQQWLYQDLASEFLPTFGKEYNVRPHWNKMLFNNETYFETVYPKLNDWLEIQEKNDPHCQLVNPFLANSLGIDRCKPLFA